MIFRDLGTYPKLVGGVDAASGAAAEAFYRSMLDAKVMLLPDAETAEFAKLAESVYRDVNIALANELAKAAETLGVSYGAVKAASNSQPYSHLHDPGLGVGGHCIPVYPYFLSGAVDAPLTALGREVNDSMAQHAVERLETELGGLAGQTVLILGLAYRGGVKEATLSSAILVAAEAKTPRRAGTGPRPVVQRRRDGVVRAAGHRAATIGAGGGGCAAGYARRVRIAGPRDVEGRSSVSRWSRGVRARAC